MAQQIQIRNDTAANWTAANPTLAQGEIGLERGSNFYKVGDGATAWNALAYAGERSVDVLDVAVMSDQVTPSVPTSGLKFYAKNLGGRMLLRHLGPSGLSTPLQPSFFQNFISMISTNTTTTITAVGTSPASVGTISHPAVTEQYGYMANFASAATAGITCGTGNSVTTFLRGGTGGGGFFYAARVAFPDASYNETGTGTGSRIFCGMTSHTMILTVTANDPASTHVAGFQRLHVNGSTTDTNWHFWTKNGSTSDRVDTGLEFLPGKIYDCFIFCAPSGSVISWRIDNVSDGTSAEGSTSQYLPTEGTLLRGGAQLCTVNAVIRNLRMQRIYIESDR